MLTIKNKHELRKTVSDSPALFNDVWQELLWFDSQSEIDDLPALYDSIVSNKVNDSNSKFYIYG